MKIVIDIPKEIYIHLSERYKYQNIDDIGLSELDKVGVSIKNGKPLPKGHGRIIDADAYRKELWIEIPNLDYDGSLEPYEEGIYSAIMSLDDAPTIIEGSDSE